MKHDFPTAEKIDVLMLLEGTYPFVKGGVSSWIHNILLGFPEYKFGAIFLGSRPDDYEGILYQLPDNLVHIEAHYLFADYEAPPIQAEHGNAENFKHIEKIHEWFCQPNENNYTDKLQDIDFYLNPKSGVDHKQFLYSKCAWDYITKMYDENCTDPSFLNYFWAIRNMHRPIWTLAQIAAKTPQAKVVHSISTGYAGFLATLLHYELKVPLILSEHGIYTKERRIDLLQSPLFSQKNNPFIQPAFDIGHLQKTWIGFFNSIGRFCYKAANPVVSLFEATRQRQIEDGAKPETTQIIANGIDISHYGKARQETIDTIPPIMCLLGRVVPIKDVKTFIRAMRSVTLKIPNAEGWIVGPLDEDEKYVEECRNLVESLSLDNNVKFLGTQNTVEILPKIGLMVLSSISEGLPLAILESYAAGVPVVTTNVGCCEELVYGSDDEADKNLGASGSVVSIANPTALGQACIELLSNKETWLSARAAAIARVERYYTQEIMFANYRRIYQEAI